MTETDRVAKHYQLPGVVDRIFAALEKAGVDVERLSPEDLAPADSFHIRGREATKELARLAKLDAADSVLDVGCGVGGACRYLATTFGCRMTGIDLTPEYVEAARILSDKVGLSSRIEFHEGSALALPFDDGSFDAVWTEHVQMNVAKKARFYDEIQRVLRPGGTFLFHDIFAGDGGPIHFPVPWAERADISHLASAAELRAHLHVLGFREIEWTDVTERSAEWFHTSIERARAGKRPIVGVHLLMGETAPLKLANMARNLAEARVTVVQAALAR